MSQSYDIAVIKSFCRKIYHHRNISKTNVLVRFLLSVPLFSKSKNIPTSMSISARATFRKQIEKYRDTDRKQLYVEALKKCLFYVILCNECTN